MIYTNTMLGLSEPLPQWLNFLAMAAVILLVAAGTLVWYVVFRKGRKPRKRKHRRHHREQRALNPTLAQSGGLPPVRKEENPEAPAPPP
jgi:peptidoglycan/LPS O-acetylase OafA/YrhL